MSPKKLQSVLCTLSLVVLVVTGCSTGSNSEVIVEPLTVYEPKPELEWVHSIRSAKDTRKKLSELYQDITLIDIHNHAAENPSAVNEWTKYGIDRIVLFGDISEPSAQATDQLAWEHYRKDPSHVYPSFAGFPIYEEEGLSIVQEKLEQGYLNIGEVAAASSFSPVVSQVKWKAKHPNDGNLPQIYELAAKYHVPVLLHIDPPNGQPIEHLEKALEQHLDTTLIFGHANAYNTPENIKHLLDKHPNLYIDFFAGFTAYSPDSTLTLKDFVPLM
ncbi:amidohydrolase family protein [Paenibacillus sp. IHBB 10380]|uniref:amidohydrolase family protein n=1 Tax=Paenibacillus sp. IHBB 10380 TaxID=1566358 RepID=UPI00069660E9|nr:amidohydrolase [Paenibacillus sp. IHBB 10380]